MKLKTHIVTTVLICVFCVAQAQNHKPSNSIKSGIYSGMGNFTIGIDNGILTGRYEYLGQWDDKLNTYMRQDYFNLYGTSTDGTHYKVIAMDSGFPEGRAKGTIYYNSKNNSIKIILDHNPGTGQSFDMTEESEHSIFKIETPALILSMGYVKSPKTYLYNFDGRSFSKLKGYLIKGDEIIIKERKQDYTKIGFESLKTYTINNYWVSNKDLEIMTSSNL